MAPTAANIDEADPLLVAAVEDAALELELLPTHTPPAGSDPDAQTTSPSPSPAAAAVEHDVATGPPAGVARRLYISHLLSAGNSRVFEFGSVLYLAAIFPGTLLPMSVYAVCRQLAAAVLSSLVGHYIDSGDRLQVVRLSIVLQRSVVAVSCAFFYLLSIGAASSQTLRVVLFAMLCVMASVEKLASIMNRVSVEKDWVIVVARNDMQSLRVMNSQMRRIDLVCKLAGPLFIGLVDGASTKVAILVNLGMNVASVVVEYYSIANVYWSMPELQRPKAVVTPEFDILNDVRPARGSSIRRRITFAVRKLGRDMALYFNHAVFLPSFSCALLYFTVLAFSGQMVTYLLSTGYTSTQVAIARTVSAAFEVMATWLAPWLMHNIGTVRAGLWCLSWQAGVLSLGMSAFWLFQDQPLIAAAGLVGSTILSRVGLWGFDLATQIIIQEDVEPDNRGAFSAVEASWQNVFELLSSVMTIVMYSPDKFKWPVTTSAFAVWKNNISPAKVAWVMMKKAQV